MEWNSVLQSALYGAVLLCLAYLVALYAFMLVLLVFAALENALRRRQSHVEDHNRLVTSRFTIPVSVIVPAYNEEVIILPAVRALLAFRYSEFEVIVVNDGSTDGTLDVLARAFDLQSQEVFYKRLLPCSEVRAIYRTPTEPRLTVVDKWNGGGKADALNCGANLARYRYLCCVDADAIYARDALLKGMGLVVKDPGRVVGVTSLIGVARYPEIDEKAGSGRTKLDVTFLSNFDHLDFMRSFLNSRLAWTRLRFMLSASGAFMIWRKDLLTEVGGFSKDFSCEDLEMTFRVNERFLRARRPYRLLSLPDLVGKTEGPDTISRLVSQRARWQRVILETVWHYRRLIGNPRYGSVGLVGVPYYLLGEALAPFVEGVAVATLLLAGLFGLLDWKEFLSMVGIMAFGTGIATSTAIYLHDASFRDYRLRDLIRLILLGPLDFFLFRPIIFYAQFKGAWGFFRGDRAWRKFERNKRRPLAAT